MYRLTEGYPYFLHRSIVIAQIDKNFFKLDIGDLSDSGRFNQKGDDLQSGLWRNCFHGALI
ncbi:MAG: hypothetical protein WCF19_00625 [Chlamydiales bacterium]